MCSSDMKYLVVVFSILVCACAAPPGGQRVAGGSPAVRGNFPQVGSLQWCFTGICQHQCGIAILTQNRVLTAAHCVVESPGFGTLQVRVGIQELDEAIGFGQILPVAFSIIHPDFPGGVGPNDIAILGLEGLLTFNTFVLPAALPPAGSIQSGNATFAGWGSTSTTATPNFPNQIHSVVKNIITPEVCATALTALFGTPEPLTDSNSCTGPLTGGVGACQGDAGGPLLQANTLIGINSWGIVPCGFPGAPSVFVRVSAYIDFIQFFL